MRAAPPRTIVDYFLISSDIAVVGEVVDLDSSVEAFKKGDHSGFKGLVEHDEKVIYGKIEIRFKVRKIAKGVTLLQEGNEIRVWVPSWVKGGRGGFMPGHENLMKGPVLMFARVFTENDARVYESSLCFNSELFKDAKSFFDNFDPEVDGKGDLENLR